MSAEGALGQGSQNAGQHLLKNSLPLLLLLDPELSGTPGPFLLWSPLEGSLPFSLPFCSGDCGPPYSAAQLPAAW